MKFDIMGRIRNMDLPDGKTAVLYSVYEAVSNSIHAIIDRFGDDEAAEKGRISVDIELNDDSEVETITVTDNGVGFNEGVLTSFETSDSRHKYTRGGKGVGRFVWIKTFSEISVKSRYKAGDVTQSISFVFDPEAESSFKSFKIRETDKDPGTKIKISSPRRTQGGRMNQATFMKDLALHFFPLYISKTLPKIDLTYNYETRNLNEFIEDKVEPAVREDINFEIDGETWDISIDHIFVDPNISAELRNSYVLTAHGRLVGDPTPIEKRYALRDLPGGRAYVAVVSGEPLDERVDQQRLNFRFNNTQRDALEAAILANVESFLADHISTVRARQRATVETVLYEHPQLTSQIENLDEYVAGLYPGMDDEQIAQNLFVLLYREERNARKRLGQLAKAGTLNEAQRRQAQETLDELTEQERLRLAELVVKRHQVLEAANMLLKYADEEAESYYYEKVIHDLVCPMGEMYSSGDYRDHNLWIIDDRLASYELIASDKSIKHITKESSSKKEPDLVFFNPLGFRRLGTNDPVTIVEFKRPGDRLPSKNPVDQVLEYIEEFRGHKARDIDGEVIADITDDTPFQCSSCAS